jgi:GNAT superfamily N-acetyltransferase
MLSTVATFNELPEAYILRGRLLAEDIPAWVIHEYQIGNFWFRAIAWHGAWVQVPTIVEAEAFEIVRAAKAGEFQELLEEQFGDLDEPHCPKCGTADCWKRRPIVRGSLTLFYGVLTATIPPLLRWIYFCNKCGKWFHSQYGLIGKADACSQFDLDFAEAVAADIPEMMDVRQSVRENMLRISYAEEAARYHSVLNAGGNGWVCRIGGFLRGFAIADADSRKITALFIHPYFKRDGLGRYLHNRAVDWLFSQNPAPIRLVTEPSTPAQRFFRRAGWRLDDADEHGNYFYQLEPEIWKLRRAKF